MWNTSLTTIFAFLVLIAFGEGISRIVREMVKSRERVKLAEQQTRRVEAFAKLSEAERKLLLEEMPDWLNPDDPGDVAGWKKARGEVAVRGKKS